MGLRRTWVDCRACGRSTHHEVLFEHVEETDPSLYHEKNTWQVVKCLGCDTVGFLYRNDDYERVFEGPDGEPRHEVRINLYPSVIKNHRGLSQSYLIPTLIQKIYRQTLTALSEKAFVLASVGLRATIEATCNHLSISGATLEKRIDQLYKSGHVSNGDKKRLHAIRFLGNDAVHEIKEPKESELRVALEIVEHMLNSVFILEKRAKSLETVVENFEEFVPVLESCASTHPKGQGISFSALLGRHRRQVGQRLDEFEEKLKNEIAAGNIGFLRLGAVQNVGGKDVQFYEPVASNADASDDDDDLDEPPF